MSIRNKTASLTLAIHDPFDKSFITEVSVSDELAVEQALAISERLFRNRDQWLSNETYRRILHKTLSIMIDEVDEFTVLITQESGKPLVDSKTETVYAIETLKYFHKYLEKNSPYCEEEILNLDSDCQAIHKKDPIGVIVVISSLFKPLMSVVEQLIPAILSGCPVIIKPSEETPLTCFKFIKILQQAGLPIDWCQTLVINNPDVVVQLVSDERVKILSYSGEEKLGWLLNSRLSPGTRSLIEHGCATPFFVSEHANKNKLLEFISRSAFRESGQQLDSIQRVFVPSSQVGDFVEGIAEIVKNYPLGNPISQDTVIGPLINESELIRVDEWVKEAIAMGADLICGGHKQLNTCYESTVLLNPSYQAKVSSEAIYGPVVCIYPYDDLKQAVKQANISSYISYAGISSEDTEEISYIANHLKATSILVNQYTHPPNGEVSHQQLQSSFISKFGIQKIFRNMLIEKKLFLSKNLHN